MSGRGRAARSWRVRLGIGGVTAAVLTVLVTQAAPFGVADQRSARGGTGASYIVTFETGTGAAEQQDTRREVTAAGGEIQRTYGHALRGFAADLTPEALARLRRDADVRSVTPDLALHATGEVESPAPWNLDRIDQRGRALTNSFSYDGDGSGITVFMLDSGIRPDHVEFRGRVAAGFDAINDGRGTSDCNGHGTHTAGTVGSTHYGVAKGVTLVPVRVLDCEGRGDSSRVITGLDWVIGHQVPGRSIINLSLGGQANTAVDDAVNAASNAGIPVVVAAGNDGQDACGTSPARVPNAITVGATDASDSRAGFSNFGSCVDLFAPGVNITSAWPTSTTAVNSASGTSSAAPLATGVLAVLLQRAPGARPAALRAALGSASTIGALTDPGAGSPNALLYAPPRQRLAGVGSATTAPFVAALAADPSALAVDGAPQVDAIPVTGPTPIAVQDPATMPGCSIPRPTSQAAARAALLTSLAAADGCVQFAQAEDADLSAASPRLVYVPFATENVSFAVTSVSNIGRNLTLSALRAIYRCEADPAFRPMLPRAGTGLREYWLRLMYGTSGLPSPKPACLEDGIDERGRPIEANSGHQLNNNEIVPFSVSQWSDQVTGVVDADLRSATGLGQMEGLSPFTDGFPAERTLYVVFAESALTGTSVTDLRIRSAFVGSGSLLCRAMTARLPQRFGFRPAPSCGSTTLLTR